MSDTPGERKEEDVIEKSCIENVNAK